MLSSPKVLTQGFMVHLNRLDLLWFDQEQQSLGTS
jgi:hypothetical protein